MDKTIVICSGGMDSTTLLYKIVEDIKKENVEVLTFDYGSKHNKCEIPMIEKICKKLDVKQTIIKMDFINKHFKSDLLQSGGEIPEGYYKDDNMKQTVVSFRNGIMLSIAAGFADSNNAKYIALGNHGGDHFIYKDCRSDFIFSMNNSIKLGTDNEVQIYNPFTNITKTDIALIGDKLNVDWSLTWTCYKGLDKHCGKCGSCIERKEAFRDSGVGDIIEYME